MLEFERENEGTYVLDLSGRLTAAEMERGLDRLISMTKDEQDAKMLYRIDDFEMPELGALAVEFGKLPQLFGLVSKFSKIAVLADEAWLRTVAEWEGMLIPGMEIRGFDRDEEAVARDWLEKA